MKLNILLIILITHFTYAQNYAYVDSIVKKYPSHLNSIESISKKILEDFTTEEDRVRAAFTWVAINIEYDAYKKNPFKSRSEIISYYSEYDLKRILRKKIQQKIKNILTSKKGVCQDYSLIFNKLCKRIGVPVQSIIGFSRNGINDIGNKQSFKDHMWNAVYVNNEWKLIDVTWAVGHYNFETNRYVTHFNDYYFFPPPHEFINHHFPENPIWQLLENKVTIDFFFSSPFLFHYYFTEKFKLSNTEQGVLNLEYKQKRIVISFDEIPKNGRKINYTFFNDKQLYSVYLTKNKSNKYEGRIPVKEKHNNQSLTLFSRGKPIASFKIASK